MQEVNIHELLILKKLPLIMQHSVVVCLSILISLPEKIISLGFVVEINENKFGKWKFNQG